MANSFNPLDPMSNSAYWEYEYPGTIEEVVKYYDNVPNPAGPKLRPQLTKDGWYYSKDASDDGHISPFEKLKAFVKGGSYNMIRGLFCDKDGFSFSRTLTSAVAATAIYLTGPIGMAIAGGIGLIAAADNFAHSAKLAKTANTDQQAREAYEGIGESASTAGLSLFGGYKGLQAIKNNFSWAKLHPNMKVGFLDKLLKWNSSKFAKLRPSKQRVQNEQPNVEKPQVDTPIKPNKIETENISNINPKEIYYDAPESSVGGAGSPVEIKGEYFPETTPTEVYPHTGKNARTPASEYFSETEPTGNISKPTLNNTKPQESQFFSETTPTGYKPDAKKQITPEYLSETAPTGEIPTSKNNMPDVEWFGF